jgi:hypothetical protein
VTPYVFALIVHGVIGGIDVILNHELIARLPYQPAAASEERLHALRELLFGAAFASAAWYEWHGVLAWWIPALLLAELLVSIRDAIIELDIRVLPVTERILHVLLFVNLGVIFTTLAPAVLAWQALPSGLVHVDYGWASWTLSALAALAFGWAVRDGLSARKLSHPPLTAPT